MVAAGSPSSSPTMKPSLSTVAKHAASASPGFQPSAAAQSMASAISSARRVRMRRPSVAGDNVEGGIRLSFVEAVPSNTWLRPLRQRWKVGTRRRARRTLLAFTLYDKLWNDHVVHEEDDGTCLLYVDRHLVDEIDSPQAFAALRSSGRTVKAPGKTLLV